MSPPARPLRRDAAENAERLLAAAVRSGLARGEQVPMAEIAAQAGVGIGTLYRRYPNREALLLALQLRAFTLLIEIAEHAEATSATGIEGVEEFLRGSFAIRDQLVLPLHGAPVHPGEESAQLRGRLHQLLTAIVERGHADATIRTDASARTVVEFGAMLAQPLPVQAGDDVRAAAQRAIFLRGISAG